MTIWRVIANAQDHRGGRVLGPLFDEACALGKNGVVVAKEKREGDGKTPMGSFPFHRVFYRPDRIEPPVTQLLCEPLSPNHGWCDAPESSFYNRLVWLPFGENHEHLWRGDHLYDLILVIGHNDDPVVANMGSAVFVHVAKENFVPTLGCVALSVDALRRLLRLAKSDDQLKIG